MKSIHADTTDGLHNIYIYTNSTDSADNVQTRCWRP